MLLTFEIGAVHRTQLVDLKKMPQDDSSFAKFGVDTAVNEPSKVFLNEGVLNEGLLFVDFLQ